jgi:hypothetical protein
MRPFAWLAVLALAAAGCNPSPFYRACATSGRTCPAGWHCSLGGFCSRLCYVDSDCTDELGAGTYCAVTGDCWRACGGDAGVCPSGTTCELGACVVPESDAGLVGGEP